MPLSVRISPRTLVQRCSVWLAMVLLATTLPAHDLYLFSASFVAKRGSATTIRLHNGDAFPGSDGPPVFERLRDVQVVHAGGVDPVRGIRQEGAAGVGNYTVPSGSYVVTARTIPNFLQLDPTQFEGYLNHEKLDWVIRWRVDNNEFAKDGRELYSKHSKALLNLQADDFALKPVGHPIEIVLLDNPTRTGVGSSIRAQVLFHGKPLASQPIEMAWTDGKRTEKRWLGETGSDGILAVKLEPAGTWKLHTIVMERCRTPEKADWESFWASLTFAVPSR